MTPGLFYLQDSRSYVGNNMLFWSASGGYTTDVSKAEVFTLETAQRQHDSRETDIPWPKEYIDARVRPACDMQYVKRDEALGGSGIVLQKPRRVKKEVFNCAHCGRFLSERQVYEACPKCGGENRP